MKKQLRFIFLLLIFSGLASSSLIAQNFGSEAELKEQAAKLFDDDKFEEAYPLYAQLASIYNKDPNINYRLGVCMLYTSDDKEKPIPFLELAVKSADVDKEVFFYLAKAYHLNYRFDDAIKQYQAYQKVASGAKAEKLQVTRQIEMCRNGKRLLRNISDLMVIDKKEMSRTDFYRSYDISAIGGKLLAKPDEETFKTPLDKKKKETSIIYFSSDNNQIYFASYGDDLSHGKDIYLVRKLPNGELSKPQTLGYPVNTEYDEDYPFLHPNGKVLYFCSKGHNSMGGYDIFKSTLNEYTNTWSKPVNLDFPINSPDDDILYITNADEKEAYFSSARSSATGKTAVYHINVERKPTDVVAVNGRILKTATDQDMNMKITVKDLETNVIIGIFNTKPETGDFSMTLPSGSKVMYTVEAPGFPTQSEVITIPSQNSATALKQEISFEPATGKLNVKNNFTEGGSDEDYLTAINLIKEKSKMEVNVNEMTQEKNNKTTGDETGIDATNPAKITNKPANLSNDEIIKIAYNDAKEAEREAKEINDQASIALVIANEKNEQAQNKAREVAQLSSSAAQMTDPAKKQQATEQANIANKDLADLNQLTVTSYNVAKALELKADAKQKEADLSLQYAKDLEAAVKSKSSSDALAKLEEQQKKLEAITQKNDASATISNSLRLDAENKKKELDKAIQTSTDIKQEITDNETAIASTEADMAKEKNDNIRQGMADQIQGLKDDIVLGKKELESNEIKVNQLQKEYNGINNQIEIFNSVVDKSKTGNNDGVNATAAAIDKTKLEQQVNTLKNSDNALASIKPIATDNAEETTANVKSSETSKETPIVKDSKTKNTTIPPTNTKPAATDKPVVVKTETPAVTKEQTITEQAVVKDNATDDTLTKNEQTGTETPNVTDNTAISDNTSPTEKTIQTSVTDASIQASDKSYEETLAAAETITDQLERETKKAEVYENWNQTLLKALDDKKQELSIEKKEEKKNAITATITALEKKLNDTRQAQTATLAAIEGIKAEQQLVINKNQETVDKSLTNPVKTDQPDKTEISEINIAKTAADKQVEAFEQVYQQEITNAENAPTPEEKENRKFKAATNYMNSVMLVVNVKKSDLQAETNPAKQQELNNEIALLQKTITEKQKVADDSNAKIVAIAKTPDTINQGITNKPEETTKETTQAVKNVINVKQETFSYTNTIAKNSLQKASAIDKEAEDMFIESKKIKEQAALQNDPIEKNALYAKADELTIIAEKKKIEAAQLVGTANISEYKNNQHAVSQYVNSSVGAADQLSVAELMNDEAKMYYDKAQNSRKAAASFETYYAKQAALEDAVRNEQLALQKQSNSLAIYKKNNPKLVVKPLAVTDITVPSVAAKKDGSEQSKPTLDKELINKTNETKKENTSVTETKTPITPEVVTNREKSVEETVIVPEPKKEQVVSDDVAINTDKAVKENIITTDQPLNNSTSSEKVADNTETNSGKKNREVIENNVEKTETVTNDDNSVVINKTSEKGKSKFSIKELFERRSKSKYSASNPIPLDEKLPDGLVFKVQMGAFKNAIPQDLFKGITPVTGQTTNQGFIRYFAGLFLTCETAEKAKDEIRGLGFPDAFVVAYFDGKRIPSPCGADGTMIAGTTPVEQKNVIETPVVREVTPSQPETKDKSAVITTIPAEIAPSTDVATLKGLFYTIQVGVYSKPVSGTELNNVQPLYTENVNNVIRYNVGVYNTIPIASEARKIAVNGGLKDAFMAIYYNGKRITMAEAATLTAQGTVPMASAPFLNQLPSFNNGRTQSPITNTNVPVTKSETIPQPAKKETPIVPSTTQETPVIPKPITEPTREMEKGIVFKVQIGAFHEEVPLDIANKFLKISKKGIKNYKDEKGLTIYTVGAYTTYEEADKSRKEVIAEGLPDAFVVAYSDGKKITVEEAQKLTEKK